MFEFSSFKRCQFLSPASSFVCQTVSKDSRFKDSIVSSINSINLPNSSANLTCNKNVAFICHIHYPRLPPPHTRMHARARARTLTHTHTDTDINKNPMGFNCRFVLSAGQRTAGLGSDTFHPRSWNRPETSSVSTLLDFCPLHFADLPASWSIPNSPYTHTPAHAHTHAHADQFGQ